MLSHCLTSQCCPRYRIVCLQTLLQRSVLWEMRWGNEEGIKGETVLKHTPRGGGEEQRKRITDSGEAQIHSCFRFPFSSGSLLLPVVIQRLPQPQCPRTPGLYHCGHWRSSLVSLRESLPQNELNFPGSLACKAGLWIWRSSQDEPCQCLKCGSSFLM